MPVAPIFALILSAWSQLQTQALNEALAKADPPGIAVSVSIMSHKAVQATLNRRAAGIASILVVALENESDETVAVTEPAVIRLIPQLQPVDSGAMLLEIEDAQQNSGLARLGRGVQDGLIGAAYASGRSLLRGSWPEILTSALALGPYALGRIVGAERPVLANFQALAWTKPAKLGPGESVTVHVFCSRWADNSVKLSLRLPVEKLPVVKLAQ